MVIEILRPGARGRVNWGVKVVEIGRFICQPYRAGAALGEAHE